MSAAAERHERARLLARLEPSTAWTLAHTPLEMLRAAAKARPSTAPRMPGAVRASAGRLAAPSRATPHGAEMDRRMGVTATGSVIVDYGSRLVFSTMPSAIEATKTMKHGVDRRTTSEQVPQVRDEGHRLVFSAAKLVARRRAP